MSVEETVRAGLILFPELYKTKWDVYKHLFLCNGNGYEWKNGELVEPEYSESDLSKLYVMSFKLRKDLSEDKMLKLATRLGPGSIQSSMTRYAKSILDIFQWPDRLQVPIQSWKPTSKIRETLRYTKLGSIPEDIKSDWKDAIRYFLQYIEQNKEDLVEDFTGWNEIYTETIKKV